MLVGNTKKRKDGWFKENNVKVLKWLARSPDLNPIKHLWKERERKMKHRHFTKKEKMFASMQQDWQLIQIYLLVKLGDSMSNTCLVVINNKGFFTKLIFVFSY